MTDIHAERRIHELEAQLRTARGDALEEAVKAITTDPAWTRAGIFMRARCVRRIRSLKGT